MKTNLRTASKHLLLLAACCITIVTTMASSPQVAPPQAKPYGLSLADLLKIKYTPRASNLVGKIWFLDAMEGAPSGSGTIADPMIIEARGSIRIKAGTAVYSDLISFFGESYADGSSDAPNPDRWWKKYVSGRAWIDGKVVVCDADDYYVRPQYFVPPIVYAQPTDYGSVAINFVQGSGFLIEPMSVGVHTLTQVSSIMAPANNGVIPETAIIFRNTWTITVVR